MTLADRLHDSTKSLHVEVERTPFIRAMLTNQLSPEHYVLLLRNLHALYAQLEKTLIRHRAHPVIEPIFEPALFRTAALELDLAERSGADWRSLPLAEAMTAYVGRLRDLELAAPELLAAHVYVRSLGDLNGGRVLAKIAGGAFYDFGPPEASASLSAALRAGLASLSLDEETEDAIVLEARRAFSRHGDLFAELEQLRNASHQKNSGTR